jgi:uncharacterized protein (DUF2147 family)
MKRIALAAAAFLLHTAALAQATPVGLWKTIDDKTGKERSLIRIAENAGVLTGRIEKSLDPGNDQSAVCDKCTDERKGKPLIGMAIIRNVKQNADDKAIWDGGDITDPDNGKTYRLRLKPQDGGKQLEVRGYIGPFFRNQTWIRVE